MEAHGPFLWPLEANNNSRCEDPLNRIKVGGWGVLKTSKVVVYIDPISLFHHCLCDRDFFRNAFHGSFLGHDDGEFRCLGSQV